MNYPPTNGNQDDVDKGRRACIRYQLNLDVLVVLESGNHIAFKARDFCVAGMFLGSESQDLQQLAQGVKATLYFSLLIDGERKDCQLSLKIVRVAATGIGVSFVDPGEDEIRMLQSLATAYRPPMDEPRPAQGEEQLSESPARDGEQLSDGAVAADFVATMDALQELVRGLLENTFDEFIAAADERLFVLARDAESNTEQTMYFDAQNELRSYKGDMGPHFVASFLDKLRDPEQHIQTQMTDLGLAELSLIDERDFEDFLTVSEMVARIGPDHKETIGKIERLMATVYGKRLEDDYMPLSVNTLCGSCADEFKVFRSDKRAIEVIYQVMEHSISSDLGEFYQQVLGLLEEHGVKPWDTATKIKTQRQPEPVAPQPEPDMIELPGFGADPLSEGDLAVSDPAVEVPLAPVSSDLPALNPDMMAPPIPTAPAPVGGADPWASATEMDAQQLHVPPVASPLPPQVQAAPAPLPPEGMPSPDGMQGLPPIQVAPVSPAPPVAPAPDGNTGSGELASDLAGTVQPTMESVAPVSPHVSNVSPGSGLTPGSGSVQLPWSAGRQVGGGVAIPRAAGLRSIPVSAFRAMRNFMNVNRRVLSPAHPTLGSSELTPVVAPEQAYTSYEIADAISEMGGLESTDQQQGIPMTQFSSRLDNLLHRNDDESGKGMDEEQVNVIEFVGNLLKALLDDNLVSGLAKSSIRKIQIPLYKLGILDKGFIESDDHPARQMLNHMAAIQDDVAESETQQDALDRIVQRINDDFDYNEDLFKEIDEELDELLNTQHSSYAQQVAAVVAACEEEKELKKSLTQDGATHEQERSVRSSTMPQELLRWMDRIGRLAVGDELTLKIPGKGTQPATLIWSGGEEYDQYVFVDKTGAKIATMTGQQIAVQFARGTARQGSDLDALDRAMYSMVDNMHVDLEQRITHDEVTDLLDPKTFFGRLECKMGLATSNAKARGILCFIRLMLDGTLDQETERTALLEYLADKLQQYLGSGDVQIGRLTDDTFAIINGRFALKEVYKQVEALNAGLLAEPFAEQDLELEVKVCAGLVSISGEHNSVEELLEAARSACDVAGEMGGKGIYVGGEPDQEKQRRIEQLTAYIEDALGNDRLELTYSVVKPLLTTDGKSFIHIQCTIKDAKGRRVAGHLFEQAVAKSDYKLPLDQWVIHQVFQWMVANADKMDEINACVVRLSKESICHHRTAQLIVDELMETEVLPSRLCFEINNGVAVEKMPDATELVNTLKDFGCLFVLDNFGSGQSSYGYLQEIPVDFVTIDEAFVKDLGSDIKDFAMVSSINELAHVMGKRTFIKMRIEQKIIDQLREIGVDYIYHPGELKVLAEM